MAWFFDAEVVEPKAYSNEEEIRPKGGGGTSFLVIFRYVYEHMNCERKWECIQYVKG